MKERIGGTVWTGWWNVFPALCLLFLFGCDSTPTDDQSTVSAEEDVLIGEPESACGKVCPASQPLCDEERGQCVSCLNQDDCRDDQRCIGGYCLQIVCVPGKAECQDNVLRVCDQTGTSYSKITCPGPCVVDHCEDCVSSSKGCDERSQLLCEDGAWTVTGECAFNEVCFQGDCMACIPEETYCFNGDIYRCSLGEDGLTYEGFFEAKCDTGTTGQVCDDGECQDHCEVNQKFNTSVGCDYWAVDLDNASEVLEDGTLIDASQAPFAVIVSNPHDGFVATVRVFHQGEELEVVKIPPLQLVTLQLPDLGLSGSSTGKFAYSIQSNSPIVAYQFNPLDNVNVFSNDASLLLPQNALGTDYRIMTRAHSQKDHSGYLTVVASAPGKTKVLVEPTANVAQGAGAPSIPSGGSQEFMLDEGEILTLATADFGGDLTGTRVRADRRIAVFGGAEAANVPTTEGCLDGFCVYQGWACETDLDCPVTCCADHIEQQIPPIVTWGKQFLASRTTPRGIAKDSWRFLASRDDTKISCIPFQGGIPTLNAGEWFEFESDEDFMVESNHPILVGQFLASQNAPDPNSDICVAKESSPVGPGSFCAGFFDDGVYVPCEDNKDCPNRGQSGDAGVGDPAFMLLVPYGQFTDTYVFLVPEEYESSYINVVSPVGANIELSGVVLGEEYFSEMGNGLFWAGRISVEPGVHRLTSDRRVGVMVYGWSPFVSYGYPAGQSLDILTLE